MLQIYAVDDELMAIEYFQMLLEGCSVDCTLMGYATSSQKAVEDILRCRPDLCFIDINMPGMSGMELAEKLNQNIPGIKIIFLTAYRDFDFAKQGIEMGVVSYLLKNKLDKDSLEKELRSVCAIINKERATKRYINDINLRSYLMELDTPPLPDMEIGRSQWYQMFYVTSKRSFSMQRIRDIEFETDYGSFIQWGEKKGWRILAFPHVKNNVWIPVFCVGNPQGDPALAESIIEWFAKEGVNCLVVRMPVVRSLETLKNLYRQAERIEDRRLDFCDGDIVELADLENLPQEQKHLRRYEEKIRAALYNNSRLQEHEALVQALDIFSKKTNDERFIKYAQMIFNDYCSNMISSNFIREIPIEWNDREFSSKKEYNCWILGIVKEYHQMQSRNLRKGYSEKVMGALNIIEKSYMDNALSIQTIADRLEISEGYLRKMFKDEMDISVSEYILQFRINKAKGLLLNPSAKISEIYRQTGFATSQYFSTVFKKKVGLTPKEYIKETLKGVRQH